MLRRAIDRDFSQKHLARACNINISPINRRINLLVGICLAAINWLQGKQFPPWSHSHTAQHDVRPAGGAVELMVTSNTISVAHG